MDADPNDRKGAFGSWFPVVLWAGVIFGLSSIPGSRIPAGPVSFSDKIAHATVYGILGGLAFRALARTTSLRLRTAVLFATLIAVGYGISDETHQLFVPERSADPADVVADLLGGCAGALVASRVLRRRRAP